MLSRSECRGSEVCGAAAMLRMQPQGRRAGWAAARLLAKRCGVSMCQRCASAPGCATSIPAFSRYVLPPSSARTAAAMPGCSASRLGEGQG